MAAFQLRPGAEAEPSWLPPGESMSVASPIPRGRHCMLDSQSLRPWESRLGLPDCTALGAPNCKGAGSTPGAPPLRDKRRTHVSCWARLALALLGSRNRRDSRGGIVKGPFPKAGRKRERDRGLTCQGKTLLPPVAPGAGHRGASASVALLVQSSITGKPVTPTWPGSLGAHLHCPAQL